MADPQSFDRLAEDYDRFAELEPKRVVHWLVTQLPGHNGRALDAGCGSGRHTQLLARYFHDVVGVDISDALIDIARRRRPGPSISYLTTDLMSFTDSAGFDLVFSSTTLHHVPDLDAALLHLRGLVRAGGMMILIDNVASRPTPPRWVHVIGAMRNFPTDVWRVGIRQAGWLLRFRTGAPWLDHVSSDRYLSRQQFEQRYAAIFSGACFANLGYAHALVWEKKNPTPDARGHEVRREP